MSYAPYPAYKESGIPWLGEVPEGWDVKRLRFALETNPTLSSLNLSPEQMVSFVPMDAVGENGGLRLDAEKAVEDIGSGYTPFAEGDIVVAKITPCFENGKGAIAEGLTNGLALGTTELHVLRPFADLDRKFLFYLTVTEPFRKIGEGAMYGAGGQKRIDEGFIKSFRVGFPSTKEQADIADFLDKKTAEIDGLIAKQEALLRLLAEQRTALITHAVTKGLNPNAPMKPSGVVWFNQVPSHWQVRRLKDVGRLIGGAGFPHEYQNVQGKELFFYKVGDLSKSVDGIHLTAAPHTVDRETAAKLRATVIPPDAILYAKIGAALLLNRRRIATADCCIDNNMTALIVDPSTVIPLWGFYWMSTVDFGEHTNPGAVPSLSEGYQSILPITLPPIAEQQEIVERLATDTSKLDSIAKKTRAIVKRLKEYRTALITSAVTGKIKVSA